MLTFTNQDGKTIEKGTLMHPIIMLQMSNYYQLIQFEILYIMTFSMLLQLYNFAGKRM